MAYSYDDQNIFARILRGEIPNETVFESEHVLALRDVNPQAPEHVLVIPKGAYVCYDHFATAASDAEIIGFTRAVGEVCALLGLEPGAGGGGYRVIANAGRDGVQEVPHFHLHILGGRPLGRILQPA
jgi:histidine triad (HIT) family protein